MPRLTRAWLFLLFTGVGLIAGAELVPRPDRAFHTDDLWRYRAVLQEEWNGAEHRLHSGHPRPDDDLRELRVAPQLKQTRWEVRIREGQTALALLLVLASGVHLVFGLKPALRARLLLPRAGTVELAGEETVRIDPAELPHQLGRLASSRGEAISQLRNAPQLRCSVCRRRVKIPVLGRIGLRLLRPVGVEPGAESDRVLGKGWWVAPSAAPACSACGSTDLELA